MKLIKIQSQIPKTPYAENWSFVIGTSKNEIDFDSLSSFLLEKESEVKDLPFGNDGGTKLGKNSTTSRFQSFNLLSWEHPEILKIKNIIKDKVSEYNTKLSPRQVGDSSPVLWIQCWYNVLRFGQKISTHQHSDSSDGYLSGHFAIQCGNTYTSYILPKFQLGTPEYIKINNDPGILTIFPSNIFHFTSRHLSIRPRITIAFDISLIQMNSNYITI